MDGDGSVWVADLRRILYGTDESCPNCGGRGWTNEWEDADLIGTPCPVCHGTGRIKTLAYDDPGPIGKLTAESLRLRDRS
jgi:DnaJ-class molecular chaperone